MSDRIPPTNCQQEPPYPGFNTVVLSIRNPELTAHFASPRCNTDAPHLVSECGEFDIDSTTRLFKLGDTIRALDLLTATNKEHP